MLVYHEHVKKMLPEDLVLKLQGHRAGDSLIFWEQEVAAQFLGAGYQEALVAKFMSE